MSDYARNLINNLFDQKWSCETDQISLLAIQEIPDVNDEQNSILEQSQFIRLGAYGLNNGVQVYETNLDQDLLDTHFGYGRSRLNRDFLHGLQQSTRQNVQLSTTEIAEILAESGSVTLLNPKDSAQIYAWLREYLTYIHNEKGLNVHFKSPPESDLNKLTALLNMIEGLAKRFIATGEGDDIFSILSRALSPTAHGALNPVNDTLLLNGKDNNATYSGINNEALISPYSFNRL